MQINKKNRCIGCMELLDGDGACKHCGFVQEEYRPIPRCLMPGTVLAGRYTTGRVLGEGAFGITYIGWDSVLEIPVAIKEYFPYNMVSRDVICGSGNQVYVYENEKKNGYQEQLERFLEEARTLSHLSEVDGVVSVLNFFHENNTAYIVMQYIHGTKVKSYVEEKGRIPGHRVLEMFRPVLSAMEQVHGRGIIHRDISPDNVLLKDDGSLVLIDFGASRMRNMDATRTMTVMFKRGFSPEEQYRGKGRLGPCTDIYSLCATMYYMLTAEAPMDSVMRRIKDELPPLTDRKDIDLTSAQKNAIMKGMAVSAEDRYQSVGQLRKALFSQEEEPRRILGRRKKLACVAAVACAACILLAGGIYARTVRDRQPADAGAGSANPVTAGAIETPGRSPVPERLASLSGMTRGQAEKRLEHYGSLVAVTWQKEYSGKVKKGEIISQSVPEGTQIQQGDEPVRLTLTVSRGKEKKKVPQLVGRTRERAQKLLSARGFRSKIVWTTGYVRRGTVLAQGTPAGKKEAEGTRILLTLSDGSGVAAQRTPSPSPSRDSGSTDSKADKGDSFVGVIR